MVPGILRDSASASGPTGAEASMGSPLPGTNGDSEPFGNMVSQPLAVVGMSFKLPQEARSEKGFWEMLMGKRNVMTEWPADRVNIDAFYHPDANRPDTINFRGGHFLSELPSRFDAPFFSLTAAEAEAMDPQHRLALETTFHALENAGIPIEDLSGSRTSVHAGCFSDDYKGLEIRDSQHLPAYAAPGVAQCMLSNRVSWFFDLKGASMTIDTACSSSMTALDVACQGLQNGDADTGIVIGSNLLLGLDLSLVLSRMSFISPDSKCYAFDHRANGYGRGEGVGVLIVKRLSAALKANDTIRAVIRATGSGQDGWTPGITQPSPTSQENLIRATYAKAGLDMGITRYVEAHGTGTAVGDPIESLAIGNAFRKYRSPSSPMYIGSIKSNIGHLEGSSGIAGVIKAIVMLEKGILAPSANFEKLNPAIDAAALNIEVVSEPLPWPTKDLRRASVSSFGFGGSNSHVVLDDAYNFLRLHGLRGNHCTTPEPPTTNEIHREYMTSTIATSIRSLPRSVSNTDVSLKRRILVWTAADQGGIQRISDTLSDLASQLTGYSGTAEEQRHIDNLAYTLSNRRSLLAWRSFATIQSIGDLQELSRILSRPVKRLNAPKLGFVFTGQGAQYAGMAKDLLQFPAFTSSFRKSEAIFANLGCPWSLVDELLKTPDRSRINEPGVSQPICTALQIGIVDLLHSIRVSPSVAVGHSSGEIAAAYAIGALSHESACKVAYYRGFCAEELLRLQTSPAGMMSVGLSPNDLTPYLDQLQTAFSDVDLVVACINSPSSITVSGSNKQIDWLKNVLDEDQVFARKLRVNIAYHSPRMEGVAARYLKLMDDLTIGEAKHPEVPMVSSVTGDFVPFTELRTGAYWVSNMTHPVKFSDALAYAHKRKATRTSKPNPAYSKVTFTDVLEIGPHSTLQGPIQDTLRKSGARDIGYVSAIVRTAAGHDSLLQAVGTLFCRGHAVDISVLNNDFGLDVPVRMALPYLPEYSFDHSRHYWHEARSTKEGTRLRKYPRLDLLGTSSTRWNPLEAQWTNILRVSEQPWIADHRIQGSILFPAAGMIVMALEAAQQLARPNAQLAGFSVKDVSFLKPVIIPDDDTGKEVDIILRPRRGASAKDSDSWDFSIYAIEVDGSWQQKCGGLVSIQYARAVDSVDDGKEAQAKQSRDRSRYEDAREHCTRSLEPEQFYTALENGDFVYGPSLQGISEIQCSDTEVALARVATYPWPSKERNNFPQKHIVHPATLDAIFQTPFISTSRGLREMPPVTLPTRLGHLWVRSEGLSHPSLSTMNVCVETRSTKQRWEADAFAVDEETGQTIMSMDMEASSISTSDDASSADGPGKPLCYQMYWQPDVDLMSPADLVQHCDPVRAPPEEDLEYFDNIDYIMMKSLQDAIEALPESRRQDAPQWLNKFLSWAENVQRLFHDGAIGHCKPSSKTWEDISTDTARHATFIQTLQESELGRFYTSVALQLPAILDGEINALELLFGDDMVSNFYSEVNNRVINFQPLGSYLSLLTHKNSSAKILEIGAGTGASTNYFLSLLRNQSQSDAYDFARYDYTDISPAFFETATQVYATHASSMHFQVFDVEQDAATQGFENGSYDIIFAASVLHATKNLEQTMRNIRRLLKPNGKLILVEVVTETIRQSCVFGLLPGWWVGEEESRRLRPWLTTPEWHDLMQRTGFSGVDLEVPDFAADGYHEYSLIVATASHDEVKPDQVDVSILAGQEETQRPIAEGLKTALIKSGYSCDVTSFQHLAGMNTLKKRHWISLCEIDEPIVSDLDEERFMTIKRLVQSAQSILWVTSGGGEANRNPHLHAVQGLARTACTESQLAFTTLALQSPGTNIASATHDILQVFAHNQSVNPDNIEPEYEERDSLLHINRVLPAPAPTESAIVSRTQSLHDVQQPFGAGPPLALAIGSIGFLDTLHFVEDPRYHLPLLPGHVEVRVDTSGVNFRDCLTALGQLEAPYIGCEFAGIVSRTGEGTAYAIGDRVAGICPGSYQTFARGPVEQVVPVPGNLALSEAAASMIIFPTAYYSLAKVARLGKGETVLIHSAAGGTGQAAIQVALHLGATVYVTVGSPEKREFLMRTYAIPENRIFASRDMTFAKGIQRETGGRGVDVILNSLAGDSLTASWECIAPCGRFVEIGKRDIMSHGQLPMWQFRKACSFAAVDLQVLQAEHPAIFQEIARTTLDLLAKGTFFVPQPLQTFGVSQIQEAFRLFQSGTNYGKMVVQMRPDEVVEAKLKPALCSFRPDRTYVIAGGLGGLGRNIALWMAKKGARNLLLLSRSGAQSEAAKELLEKLAASHVTVHAPQCDISDSSTLARVLTDSASTLPPIAGCIQASMVLRDSVLENLSFEDWTLATRVKIEGTSNLSSLLPIGLDFFICLSSLSSIIGNGGQANYAAGNAFMDALVAARRARGQRATTINLGWVESEGVVSENSALKALFSKVESMPPVTSAQLYALLDYACDVSMPEPAGQLITGLAPPGRVEEDPAAVEVPWLRKRTFGHLVQAARQNLIRGGDGAGGGGEGGKVDYRALLREAGTAEDATAVVARCMQARLSRALAIAPEEVDLGRPLHASGVDSLFGIELRNYLAKQFDADVAVFDLMGATTAEAACALIVRRSKLRAEKGA